MIVLEYKMALIKILCICSVIIYSLTFLENGAIRWSVKAGKTLI